MNIAVCGLNCGACEYLGKTCAGCRAQKGKVFWAEPFGLSACPIYGCAEEKGLPSCGPCADKPCEKWEALREPGVTDEQHAANLKMRQNNLKQTI